MRSKLVSLLVVLLLSLSLSRFWTPLELCFILFASWTWIFRALCRILFLKPKHDSNSNRPEHSWASPWIVKSIIKKIQFLCILVQWWISFSTIHFYEKINERSNLSSNTFLEGFPFPNCVSVLFEIYDSHAFIMRRMIIFLIPRSNEIFFTWSFVTSQTSFSLINHNKYNFSLDTGFQYFRDMFHIEHKSNKIVVTQLDLVSFGTATYWTDCNSLK